MKAKRITMMAVRPINKGIDNLKSFCIESIEKEATMISGVIFKNLNVFRESFIFIFIFLFLTIDTSFASDIGLINAKKLSNELNNWVILDARPQKEWLKEHIPGSISFSWEDYTRTDEKGIKFRILKPEELAEHLGRMGINENSSIVIYGDADTSWGGEGWNFWLFNWLGHKGSIRLLYGGIQEWKNNKLPLKSGKEKISLKTVKYSYNINKTINISTEELKKNINSYIIIDTRSILEWFKGHISGAKRISWEEFFKGKERKSLNSAELKNLFKKNNIDLNKPVVYYCTGGIRSGYAWMVHTLSGLPPAINYEGGMEAWEK